MITLKCQCCGIEQAFLNSEVAFHQGWDAPPHFTHVCCNLCPAVCIVLGLGHQTAHALWAEQGRPDQFTVAKCATDDDWNRYH